jgi:ABC-2 type transport system ATP-binding protein
MTVLELNNIHFSVKPHFWSKALTILKGVSLKVPEGCIYGFLGPNGAGKTTTLKVALGLVTPQQGSISILGKTMSDPEIRQKIGFTPEHPIFPEHLSAKELVVQHGLLAGLSRKNARFAADKVLEEVNLQHAATRKLRTYSKGMLQRAGLAQALVGQPQFLLLDEPMGGVDPVGRREIREIIVRLQDQGTTILFSTHILPDVEMICDQVGILIDGEIRKTGTPEELTAQSQSSVEVVVQFPHAQIPALKTKAPHSSQGQRIIFTVASVQEANKLTDECRSHGGTIHSLTPLRRSLEDLFMTEFSQTKNGETSGGSDDN